MRTKFVVISILITILIAVLLLYSFAHLRNNSSTADIANKIISLDEMEKIGLPLFSAETIHGNKVSLDQSRDRIAIINFWASWCSPCIEEIPSLVELVNVFPDKIQVYAISADTSKEDIMAFMKSFPKLYNKDIHIILDTDHKIMNLYGTDRLPESYISDKKGRLVKKIIGTINWHTKDSEAFIQKILDKSE